METITPLLTSSVQVNLVLLGFLVAATYADLRRHRIPNVLTFGGAVLGLLLQTLVLGADGFLSGLGGLAIGLAVFLPFYVLGGMGAGDVKLMAAVGTFLGTTATLLATALTLGCGALVAVGIVWARHGLRPLLSRYGLMAKTLMLTGRVNYVPPAAGEAAATRFPYAIAIALGTVGALVWLGR